jgi:hypothetical protein
MLARICLTSKINVNSEHGLTCMPCTIPSNIIILDCVGIIILLRCNRCDKNKVVVKRWS